MPVVHLPAMATQVPSNVKNEPLDSGGFGGYSSYGRQPNLPTPAHQPKPAHQVQPKQPPPAPPVNPVKPLTPENVKDPVDISSIRGLFGWATIDGVSVPYLLREGKNYVAVRIVEQKLLARFPNTFPEELGEHEPLVSYYITQNELKLLDEINSVHCNYDYGKHSFTGKDLIVKLQEFEAFYNLVKKTFPQEVLEARKAGVPLPPPSELAASKSGWVQVNNTVTPYFRRGVVKYVVLQIIKHAAKLLQSVEVESIFPDEEEYKMINDMCKKAGLAFQFAKNTKLVSLEDVKQHHKVTLMELPTEAPMKYAQYNAKQEDSNNQTPKSANMACSVQPGKPAPQNIQKSQPAPPVQQGVQHIPDVPQRMPLNIPRAQQPMIPGHHSAGGGPVHPASGGPLHPASGGPVHPASGGPVHPASGGPVRSAGGQYPMFPPAVRDLQRPAIPQQFAPYPSQMRMPSSTSVPRQLNRPPPPYYGGPNTTVTQRTNMPNPGNSGQMARFQRFPNSGIPASGNNGPRLTSHLNPYPRSSLSSQSNLASRGSVPNVQPHHRLPNVSMYQNSMSHVRPQSIPQQSQSNSVPLVSQQDFHKSAASAASALSSAQQNLMAKQAQMFSPAFMQGMMRPQISPQMSAQNVQIHGVVPQTMSSQQMQIINAQGNQVMMNAPNQTVGNQQATHFVIPIFSQSPVGNNQMPRMNNILQRPPFQTQQGQVMGGQGMQMQGPAQSSYIPQANPRPVGPTHNIQNSEVPPFQQTPAAPASSPLIPHQITPPLSSVPSKDVAQPVASPNNIPSPNPAVHSNSTPSPSNKVKAKSWSPPEPPTNSTVNVSDRSPSVNQTRNAPMLLNTEPETEALEVVKMSKCVTGVRFQERSISCLEYEHLKGKHALVEAVCKLYFPQCKLNEFLFVLEQVLKVPTVACQPNEEKAFIHYYHLPVTVLKCNKMVKLDDLSKYYPQLSYMFPKSKTAPASERGSNKDVDNQDSGVVFVEDSGRNDSNTPAPNGQGSALEESTQNPHPDRPVSGGKRKHISGPGQPSKQLKRLEDTVERLKQNSANTKDPASSPNPPSTSDTDSSVIVIE